VKYPVLIDVSDQAKQMALTFRQENLFDSNTYKYKKSFLNKLHGNACRIAYVLSLLENQNSNIINDIHMNQAINITKELFPHAEYATNPAGLKSVEAAIKLEEWFRTNQIPLFDYTKAKQALNSEFKDDTVRSALKLLCLNGYIAQIPGQKRTVDYVVHPSIVHPSNLPLEYQYKFQTLIQPGQYVSPVSYQEVSALDPGYSLLTQETAPNGFRSNL
jgi:hypothetical protein